MLRASLACAVSLVAALTACSGAESPTDANAAGAGFGGSTAGTSATGGGSGAGAMSGGRGGSGATAGSGGSAGGLGGASGTGASSGSGASAGQGSGAAGAGASAGQSGAGGAGGAGGAPAGGMGGTQEGGRGGISGGSGTGMAGAGNATGCTRELLKTTIAAYFTALAAHDPAGLPLADPVKFTENGAVLEPGASGLWKTAGAVKYNKSALDTEVCMSATQAVVPDGSTDIPVALRLKLVDQKLTEIEMIAIRQGDYSVASNTGAMASADATVHWEDPVDAGERNSREELLAWMDKYYREFPAGVCDTSSDCKRLENGGGNFSCSAGASCASGAPMGDPMLDPRLILGDEETGIGIGFTMFQGMYTDMHMFKMYGDEVHAVHAFLASAGNSGW